MSRVSSIYRLLTDPVILFADTEPVHHGHLCEAGGSGPTDLTAISLGGICSYIDCLRQPSDLLEYLRIVHVLPGHIRRNKRKFNAMYDLPLPSKSSNPALFNHEYNRKSTYPALVASEAELQAVVTERSQEICFTYGLVA